MVKLVQVPFFELWIALDHFLKFDLSMPLLLKAHLLDLEQKILSYFVWRCDSSLLHFIQSFTGAQTPAEDTTLTQAQTQNSEDIFYEPFFRRVLHQCAYQTV
jgi:retinoblastoma-associated protein